MDSRRRLLHGICTTFTFERSLVISVVAMQSSPLEKIDRNLYVYRRKSGSGFTDSDSINVFFYALLITVLCINII